MKEKIAIMKESVNQDFASAKSLKELFDAKVKYLGKNGQLTELMKGMKDIPKEERPAFGKIVNELRDEIDAVYAKFEEVLKNQERLKQFEDESIDMFYKRDMTNNWGLADEAKRFQLGWQIGADIDFSGVILGISYGTDMGEFLKDCKFKTTTLSLGFRF